MLKNILSDIQKDSSFQTQIDINNHILYLRGRYLSPSEVEKLVKFFGAQSSYVTGESKYYYHVPRLESAELITRYLSVQTDTYENLQPHETLTIYKNKDWPSIGVIIFLERELHIEGFFDLI